MYLMLESLLLSLLFFFFVIVITVIIAVFSVLEMMAWLWFLGG